MNALERNSNENPLPWDHFSDQRNPGNYPLEALPEGWANVKVIFRHRNGQVEKRIEILDLSDQKRYIQEPMAMIAFKCFGLFIIVAPLYFLAYTLVQLIRLPIVPLVNLSPTAFLKGIWDIVRIPFYFIALECASLYGIFKPLEGRALFGKFESDLHDGKTRRESEQYQKKSLPVPYWEALSSVENQTSFFIGYCMQPIGKTDDLHVISFEILPSPTLPAV